MRPLIEDIAAKLPEEFVFTATGLPLGTRLVISLGVFIGLTGLVVAALVTDHGGSGVLLGAIGASIGVGLALTGELAMMLTHAITRPIRDLRRALEQVGTGDYEVRVPVVSSDELGALSNAFNRMAAGLAEREQIRDAFGTYVDREVANLLLSGRFPSEGIAVEVSVMFCDVPGFTAFSERSEPERSWRR